MKTLDAVAKQQATMMPAQPKSRKALTLFRDGG